MFRSISDQIDNDQNNYKKYRNLAVNYIKNLDTETKKYLNDFVGPFYKNIDEYIKKMNMDMEWGDDKIIQALSNALRRKIVIYQLNTYNKTIIEPRTFRTHEKLPITQDSIYLGHIGEHHYVSLRPTT